MVKKYFFLTDDAFISFRYLSNWLDGQGLVFNPGERVEGYTNFLWIAVLALPALLGFAPENVAPVFSAIVSMLLLILVFFARRIALDERPTSLSWLLAPLFLALMRTYGVWATSGLETRLFSLLVFCGCLFAFRAIGRTGGRDFFLACLAFALSELTRPEGMLFFGSAFALVFSGRLLSGKRLVGAKDIWGLLFFLLIVGSHFVFRYIYYGSWLPNTFYAKVGGARLGLGLAYLGLFALEYAYYFWLVPLIFFIYRSIKLRDAFSGFWLVLALPYLIYVMYLGGDHFEYRFLDPVLPIAAVLVQHGLSRWVKKAGAPGIMRITAASLFCAVFLLYQLSIPLSSGMAFAAQHRSGVLPKIDPSRTAFRYLPGFSVLAKLFSGGYKSLVDEFSAVRWEEHKLFWLQQVDQGRKFRKYIERGWLDENDLFCMPFVGAIPYYSRLRVIDFYGITDPVVARSDTRSSTWLYHERHPPSEYLERRRVDFIIKAGSILEADEYPSVPWVSEDRPYLDLSKWERRRYRARLGDTYMTFFLSRWEHRRYIARLGDTYMIFFSTRTPEELMIMSSIRGVPVYIYVPHDGQLYRPVGLGEWLKGLE